MELKQGLIVDSDGNQFYFLDNLLHREDGPAVEYTHGLKNWYIHGKLHREDGPAIEWPGHLVKEWWYNDVKIATSSQEEFERLMKLKVFW